tara:strand:- start:374 stop:793 length:420 start_codon:yes stop_codon:yes gene_type:complete
MSTKRIKLTPLMKINTSGGDVLHGLKKNEDSFIGYGETYFSMIDYQSIKAWKMHLEMTLNLIVPVGKVRFVFCDSVEDTTFRVEDIGEENYSRLTIPPKIWFGFKGISKKTSLVVNIANLTHDDKEVIKKDTKFFRYKW